MGKGPPFPAACATNTPAFTAERSAASKGFKNVVLVVAGGLFGPTERLRMSTPSWTACSQKKSSINKRKNKKQRIPQQISPKKMLNSWAKGYHLVSIAASAVLLKQETGNLFHYYEFSIRWLIWDKFANYRRINHNQFR